MEQPKHTHVKRYLSRDDWQTKSDKVGLTIDTSGDGKYGYWFSLALGDSEGDGTLMPEKSILQIGMALGMERHQIQMMDGQQSITFLGHKLRCQKMLMIE